MTALWEPRVRSLRTLELRFPSDVDSSAVEAALAALSGLPSDAVVFFDTVATPGGITHLVRTDAATADSFTRTLSVLLPGVRVEPSQSLPPTDWTMGARIGWNRRHLLLRTDEPAATAAALLAAVTPLHSTETVLVRVGVRPAYAQTLPSGRAGVATPWWWTSSSDIAESALSGIRAKYAGPVLRTRLQVGVVAGHPGRAAHLLGRVVSVARARRGAHGAVAVRRLSGSAFERTLTHRQRGSDLLSPAELVGLLGWPVGAPRLPGLELGTAPLLMPDRRIPADGRVVSISNWPGASERALAQPVEGALSHTLIAGPTGSGKSALLARLILADVEAGRGVLVADGKGDLVADLLERIPEHRVNDVIVLDPAGRGPVPGLRVFGTGGDPELAADLVLGVLRDIFRDHWGVRSDQWFRTGLVTLAHDPTSTLGDFPYLFTDHSYRHATVAKLTDPLLLASWAAFHAMSPGEQANQLGAPLTKLNELLGRRALRSVLAQPKPALDLADAIRRRRIVLVSLAPGRIGTPAARLLGALIVHGLFTAVQARVATPPDRRTPFLAYLDEPKVLGDIPVPLDGMFELARGMGVGLTISAQSLSQLTPTVRQAGLTNAASVIAFRQTSDDADLLARQLPGVTADALQHLGAYEVIARLGLGTGQIAAPATGTTIPLAPPTIDAETVRKNSALRYGVDATEVDRQLAERHQPSSGGSDGPVGKRRRQP